MTHLAQADSVVQQYWKSVLLDKIVNVNEVDCSVTEGIGILTFISIIDIFTKVVD